MDPPKRKRGRLRKNVEVVTKPVTTTKKTKKKTNNKELVLELGITGLDLNNLNISEPKPHPKESSTEHNNNIFTLTDASVSSSEEDSYQNTKVKGFKKLLKDKDIEIKELKDKIRKIQRPNVNTNHMTPLNLTLIDNNNGQPIVVDKTNIYCWWCRHSFDTMPCFIPEKYYDNKYYVFGCFCSFNCAASYNIDLNDYKVFERHSLLKQLYNTIYNNTKDLTLAPPWQALKEYGGYLSIEEFRESLIYCSKEYRFIIPPLTGIVPFIEEEYREKTPINKFSMKKDTASSDSDNLIMKRSKPLPSAGNTLMETMGLKMKKGKKH